MFSSRTQARRLQHLANERERDDANTQRSVMIVDDDGQWLIGQIDSLGNEDRVVDIPKDMSFKFLGEDQEALLDRLSAFESGVTIDVPAGGSIRRHDGNDFDTWEFRVYNGRSGSDEEYFDLAYRRIGTDAHLLYLKRHSPSRVSSR